MLNELPYSSLTEISAVNMMGLRTCTLLVEVGNRYVCESECESGCENVLVMWKTDHGQGRVFMGLIASGEFLKIYVCRGTQEMTQK